MSNFLILTSIVKLVKQKSVITKSIRCASEATFKIVKPFKLHRLDKGPSLTSTISKSEALEMYRNMQMIRKMEAAADLLYKEQKVRGFCHLYAGEEACAVGICSVKEPNDHIIASYRCHGWTFLTGASVKSILAELLGRAHGNVYGKGGSMHMYNKNFYGGNGIIGAQQPLGAGIAFAIKYNGQPNVCFTLYGDGAANQGQLMEAANMSALWDLPCVFICENNGYGMGTPSGRAAACTDYYTRGDYVPGVWVDGMDVLAVREAAKFAKQYCAAGNGPLFFEFATYRYYGHSVADSGATYRTRDEVQQVRKAFDPIMQFKSKILDANLVTKDELQSIENSAKAEVDEAVVFANNDKPISIEALVSDIYHNTPPVIVRGHTMDDIQLQPYARTADMKI